MTKDVILSILGVHIEDVKEENTDGPIEIVTAATYFFRNGKHYILYEEMEEGASTLTKNQIKITGDTRVELHKKGTHTTNMIFEKNARHLANYQTPFGEIALRVHTTDLSVQEDENKLLINVEYQLEANEEHLSDCKLAICIQNNKETA